jgi:menaquinone-dependent protoporphyrinogen IX oxidase
MDSFSGIILFFSISKNLCHSPYSMVKVFAIYLHVKQHRFFYITYLRVLLKIPKSRLATEVKAEFTDVNEHFTDGA